MGQIPEPVNFFLGHKGAVLYGLVVVVRGGKKFGGIDDFKQAARAGTGPGGGGG